VFKDGLQPIDSSSVVVVPRVGCCVASAAWGSILCLQTVGRGSGLDYCVRWSPDTCPYTAAGEGLEVRIARAGRYIDVVCEGVCGEKYAENDNGADQHQKLPAPHGFYSRHKTSCSLDLLFTGVSLFGRHHLLCRAAAQVWALLIHA